MKKIFSIDRIEKNIAVCISDDDDRILTHTDTLHGMKTHDVFSAELCGDVLSDITPLPEERDRRIRRNKELLQKIIEKNKK